jgi:hypothetical protein
MKIDMELKQRIPTEYELAGRWQLNARGLAPVFIVAGGILLFGLSFGLGIIIRGLLRGVYEGQFSVGGLISFPIILGTIVAAIVLHEAVHGVLFLVQGAKPRFGMKLVGRFIPVAYTTSTVPIRRNQYLLVCLGPFLMITLIFLFIGILATGDNFAALALMAMALNVSGSIGDIIAANKVRRYDRLTLFQDTEDGFKWYVPSSGSQTRKMEG